MKHLPSLLLLPGILTMAASSAMAEEKAATAAGTNAITVPVVYSPGPLNEYLRKQNSLFDQWDLGGQVRARVEDKRYFATPGVPGAVDFSAKGNSDNTYFLLREKVHVGYTPAPWFTIFGEARDSSEQKDERKPSPDKDMIDLYQGFIRIGDSNSFPVSLKVGRQELIYGDERLIGNAEFNNVPRSFDAAKIRYESDLLWVDGFVSRPVVARDNKFNLSNEHDNFSGVYGSTKKLVPKTETQLYFLARNTSIDSPTFIGKPLTPLPSPRDIYTAGGRLRSVPGAFGGWDYEVEGAYQFGRFKTTAKSASLTQDAFATHVAGGYTFSDTYGAPRVGLEYNYASGDDNPTDKTHGTFDNLFPSNHKFYGFMDLVSWQNIHNLRLTSGIKPLRNVILTGDVHAFWLADNHDFFYNVGGAPRNTGGYGIKPNAGDFVGTEIDIIATYLIKPYASIQGGFGRFFAGDYIENSLKATGTKDANWLYAQVLFNF